MYLLEQILNGLCQGSIYALMAIGYTMIYGVVGLVTFSYGEVVMLGAFSAFYISTAFGSNIVLGSIVGFVGAGLIGIVIHKVCYEKFLDAPKHIALLCTIGMSMLLKNLAQIIFGSQVKAMPEVIVSKNIEFLGLRVTNLQIIILAVVIILSISLSLFLSRTKGGMMLRAVSQDKKAASLVGINVKRTTMLGNCIGCGLGGVAGVLLGIYYGTIVPTMGGMVGLKAMSACVLGGLTNIPGAAIGGLTIGVLENLGIMVFSSGYRDMFAFIFLVIVLLFCPQGLFIKRKERK